jgi:hypothetical protein
VSIILPLLEKAIASAAKGNTSVCYLLESKRNPSHWVQITWDMLNFSYPFPRDPLQVLAKLGISGLEKDLCGWVTMKFVTFEHGGGNASAAARFVEDYVRGVFGITDIEMEMKIEEQDL